MIEEPIVLKTNDGNLDCTVFITNKKKNSLIIFYMDAPGIREELRVMCRRIASNGYNVILPNLFYRYGTEGNYPFDQNNYKKSKAELEKMIHIMNKTSNSMISDDTKFILEYTSKNFNNKNIGIIGYCMSGRFVVYCGAKFANKISAIASFYGVDILTKAEDSAHLFISKIKGELYLGFAEKDIWVSSDVIKKIRASLLNTTTKAEIEIYSNTDHGFAFPSRSTYVKEAEELHWKRLLDLFKRNL